MNPWTCWAIRAGLHLDGYGVVFTSEVSLVITPTHQPVPAGDPPRPAAIASTSAAWSACRFSRPAMQEMLRSMAAAHVLSVPANQQMVLAVRLYYGAWEDTTGMPAQVDHAGRAAPMPPPEIVETEER